MYFDGNWNEVTLRLFSIRSIARMKFSKSELNTVGHSEALAPWLFCQVKRI